MHGCDELVGLFQRHGQRLLTKDGNAGLDALHRRVEMDEIRRHDQGVIDPLADRLLRLGGDHLVVARIPLDWVGPFAGFVHRHPRIRVQGADRDTPRPVEMNGLLVRMDDKGPATTADQADVQRSLRHGFTPFRIVSSGQITGGPGAP